MKRTSLVATTRHAALRRERNGGCNVRLFAGAAQSLQLDVEAALEELQPARQRLVGVLLLAVDDRAADVALHRAGDGDEAADVFRGEPRAIDGRDAALLAFEIRAAHETRRVHVARLGLAQQRESRRRGAIAVLAHEQVDADDRLDARPKRRLVELHHREQVVLIGDADGEACPWLRPRRRDRRRARRCRRASIRCAAGGGRRTRSCRHASVVVEAELVHELDGVEQVRDRLERTPMLRARLVTLQRGEVHGRRVTLVRAELEAGIAGVELHHQRIPRGFREDRGGADGRVRIVAADDGLDGAAQSRGRARAAVGCRRPGCASGTRRSPIRRAAHRQEGGLEDVDGVDFVAVGPADGPGHGALANLGGEDVAFFGRELLGVRQTLGSGDWGRGSRPPPPPGRRAGRGRPHRRQRRAHGSS